MPSSVNIYDLKPCDKTLQAEAEKQKAWLKEKEKRLNRRSKKKSKEPEEPTKDTAIARKPKIEYATKAINAPRKKNKGTEKFTKMDLAEVYRKCGLTKIQQAIGPKLFRTGSTFSAISRDSRGSLGSKSYMSNLLTKNSSFIMPLNSRIPSLETTTTNFFNAAPPSGTNTDGVSFILPPPRRSINTLTSRSLSPGKFLKYEKTDRRASSAKERRETSSLIPDRKPSNSSSRNHFKTIDNSIISPKKSISRASSHLQQKTQITLNKRESKPLHDSSEKLPKKDRVDPVEKSKKNDNRAKSKQNKHKIENIYGNKIELKDVQIKIRDRSESPVKCKTENQHSSPKKSQMKEANINSKSRTASPIKLHFDKDSTNINRLTSPKKPQKEVEEKSKNTYDTSSLLKWLTEDLLPTERCWPIKNQHCDFNRVTSPNEWTIEDLTDRCRSPKISRNAARFSPPLKCQLEEKLQVIKNRMDVKVIDRSSSPIRFKEPQVEKQFKNRGRSSLNEVIEKRGLSASRVRFSSPKKTQNELDRPLRNYVNEKYEKHRVLSSSTVAVLSPKQPQNDVQHPLKNTLQASLQQEERKCISRRFRSTSASPKKSQSQYPSPKKTDVEKHTKIVYAEEYLKNKRNLSFSAPFRRTTGSQCDRPNRNKSVETSLGTDNMAYTQQYGVCGHSNSPCNVYKFLVQLA